MARGNQVRPQAGSWGQREQHAGEQSGKPIVGKLPPHGKALLVRQRFGNPPFAAVVCVGQSAWEDAKRWQKRDDISPLVLPDGEPPEHFRWPVSDCLVVIEWSTGPDDTFIVRLVRCLLNAGAEAVTVIPRFVGHSEPAYERIDGQWRQVREVIRTYRPSRKEVHLAA